MGLLLVSNGLIRTETAKEYVETLSGSLIPSFSWNTRASLVTVTVYYSMMAQYTDLEEETFVLQGPATVQELIDTVAVRHRSMAEMFPTMLTLVDGGSAKPTALLKDGDTVQFIPISAGG
jgi:molybdopterin converting factor small subunit